MSAPGPDLGQYRSSTDDWLAEERRRRLRTTSRLSRLVTAIDLFTPELDARVQRTCALQSSSEG